MAGVLPGLALSQQIDQNGQPLAGALLYILQVGTVATPQNSYQDFGLTILNPNPLQADQTGRIPMFYLADGQVHVRLTDANGVVILDQATMQVVGPSSGGGAQSGGSIDPTTIASTGDTKFRATSETLTGWVKLNGLSIGSPTSGASQRANNDTQNLFSYLWGNFTNAHCPVNGGRGSSALADFQANKTIQLPDWRSSTPVGLDDMGNTAAGILQASNVTSGGGDGPTTPGAYGGEANHLLLTQEIPSHVHGVNDPGHTHNTVSGNDLWVQGGATVGGSGSGGIHLDTIASAATGISIQATGGGSVHNNISPFVLGTFYMKL